MSDARPVVSVDRLAEQQQQILAEQRTMRDEMLAQGAVVRRFGNTQEALLDELRAIHRLLSHAVRHANVG